jgi:hypothetical protein
LEKIANEICYKILPLIGTEMSIREVFNESDKKEVLKQIVKVLEAKIK